MDHGLVWVWEILQSRHWVVNCHGGNPQTYKTHGGRYCTQVGNAYHHILSHLHRYHCGHGGPQQKALWCGHSWWDINGYVQSLISPQGPGFLCKTQWGLLLLCDVAPQWCLCPLAGNGHWTCHVGGGGGLQAPHTMGHLRRTPCFYCGFVPTWLQVPLTQRV